MGASRRKGAFGDRAPSVAEACQFARQGEGLAFSAAITLGGGQAALSFGTGPETTAQ